MKPCPSTRNLQPPGFTLVELLTVIAIIVILMGLLFPTIAAVKNQAKSAQAKSDATSLVTAVKAYYTEYGRYPIPASLLSNAEDYTYDNQNGNNINILMGILMADTNNPTHGSSWSLTTDNPRQIVFFEGPAAKVVGGYGLQQTNGSANGINYARGDLVDPWGKQYYVRIDMDYDGEIRQPESGDPLYRGGVIAWSAGADGTHSYSAAWTAGENKDNPSSWK